MNQTKQIRQLKKKLEVEKQKNKLLQKRLKTYERERDTIPPDPLKARTPEQLIREGRYRAHLFSKLSFGGYLLTLLMTSRTYASTQTLLSYLRRFRLPLLLWRIGRYLLLFLRTGALLFLIAFLVVFLVIPLLLGAAIFLALLTLWGGRRIHRDLKESLVDKKIYVFFPSKRVSLCQDSFFFRNALALSCEEGAYVIVVSPHYFLPDAVDSRGYLLTKQQSECLMFMRKYCFFSFRRRVLAPIDERIRYIY